VNGLEGELRLVEGPSIPAKWISANTWLLLQMHEETILKASWSVLHALLSL
jgi:hypothetical protein